MVRQWVKRESHRAVEFEKLMACKLPVSLPKLFSIFLVILCPISSFIIPREVRQTYLSDSLLLHLPWSALWWLRAQVGGMYVKTTDVCAWYCKAQNTAGVLPMQSCLLLSHGFYESLLKFASFKLILLINTLRKAMLSAQGVFTACHELALSTLKASIINACRPISSIFKYCRMQLASLWDINDLLLSSTAVVQP